ASNVRALPWTNSAPSSTGTGQSWSRRVSTRPPMRGRASSTRTVLLARTSTSAAASPAAPAPTTTTSTVSSATLEASSSGAPVVAGIVVERPALVRSTVLSRAAAGLLVRFLQALPLAAVEALARSVAALAYVLGIRRRVTLDNLAHAFPDRPAEERR